MYNIKDFEIMAPVGSRESLAAAIQAGADSIYFGIESLNMRARSASTFTINDLREIAQICDEHGIKSYLTINTIIYDEDVKLMRTIVDAAKEAGIDIGAIARQFSSSQTFTQIPQFEECGEMEAAIRCFRPTFSDKIPMEDWPKPCQAIYRIGGSKEYLDMMLLGELVMFSGILPNVVSRYHRRIYWANLFAFIVAPPASMPRARQPISSLTPDEVIAFAVKTDAALVIDIITLSALPLSFFSIRIHFSIHGYGRFIAIFHKNKY